MIENIVICKTNSISCFGICYQYTYVYVAGTKVAEWSANVVYPATASDKFRFSTMSMKD